MNIVPRKALERLGFTFVLIMCVLGVYYSRTDLLFYESSYAGEDGPVEWLTVVALLMGSIMSFYRARILAPFRNKRFIFCLYFTVGDREFGRPFLTFKYRPFFKSITLKGRRIFIISTLETLKLIR